MRLQIATFISSFVLAIAAQNNSNVDYNFNCSSLTPGFSSNGQDVELFNYTAPSATTHRVSIGVFCPSNNATCNITASGRINVNATTNLTEITNMAALYPMLKRSLEAAGYRFDSSRIRTSLKDWVFQNTNKVFSIPPGQAGYVGFTPEMRCYDGTVVALPKCVTSNDESARRTADAFHGRAISICVPTLIRQRKRSRVRGELATVTISREQAESEAMDSNPAMPSRQSTPPDEVEDDGPDDNTVRTGEGGGLRVGIAASVLWGLALVMTLM